MKAFLAVFNGEKGENFRPNLIRCFVVMVAAFNVTLLNASNTIETGDRVSSGFTTATVKPEKFDLKLSQLFGIPDNGETSTSNMFTPPYSCPHDVYLNCNQYSGDPEDYGAPVPFGNHQITIISYTVEEHVNMCGTGHIIRRWTIQTPFGQGSCTQKITISNPNPFNSNHIIWPLDYDLGTCLGSAHPDDLPPLYNKPTWINNPCAMIGISYHDQIVYVGGGACRKILRTWKVMDWCTYQSNSNPPIGLWMHTQVIKFSDNEAPIITNCPDDVIVSSGSNCSSVFVQLELLEATDNCTQNLQVVNSRNQGGANASGIYPHGITNVVFTVRDDCGNTSTCRTQVTVRDGLSPTAIAHHGLGAVLMDMPGGPSITVDAALFNRGSYDNCTPMSALRFEIEPSQFDCENLGRNDIRFIVYDESGNSDWVYTYIIIQENMGMCPDSIGGTISGLVQREGGSLMTGLSVELLALESQEVSTDIYGRYKLNGLKRGESYYISPVKEGSLVEGVDARDLVLLRKYLTGEHVFTSPYKLLAADMNKSGDITYSDYLQLRMLLLLNLDQHPGMDSWRFVDKSIQFSNPNNPFAQLFNYGALIDAHTKQTKRVDFVAVKVGDLDGLAPASRLNGRSTEGQIIINTPDKHLSSGSVYEVPLYLEGEHIIHAFQIELKADINKLQLLSIKNGLGISDTEFEWITGEDGEIRLVVDHPESSMYSDGMRLITLRFQCLEDGLLSNSLSINNQQMNALVFDEELNESFLYLEFKERANGINIGNESALSISPNPFTNNTWIEFNTEEAGDVFIEMLGLDGKLISSVRFDALKGNNNFMVNRHSSQQPGMYILRVFNSQLHLSSKIIVRD